MQYKSSNSTVFNFFLLFALALGSCSSIKRLAVRKDVVQIIKTDPLFSSHFTGLSLYDLIEDEYIVNYNAEKAFTPASNTKLLTAYATLKTFPDSLPALVFQKSGNVTIVKFIGNPTFMHPEFDASKVQEFLQAQDSLLFITPTKRKRYGNGWAWDDYAFAFQPELNEYPIYGNMVWIEAANSISVVPSFFSEFVDIVATDSSKKPNRTEWYNSFQIERDTGITKVPFVTSKELFLNLVIDSLGINPLFTDSQQVVSPDTLYSFSTREIVTYMMAASDNFFAEQLLLMCALKSGFKEIGTFIEYFQQVELNEMSKFNWVDGSGLSRYNLIKPIDQVRLLIKMYDDIEWEMLSELMVSGGEGTLKNYYKSPETYLWAKTGTLSNNHNLSGYLATNNGKILAFSFMNNNYLGDTREVKETMEDLLIKIKNAYN